MQLPTTQGQRRLPSIRREHIKTHKLGRSESCGNSDVRRVPSLHDPPNPGMVVSRVEGEPTTIQKHLIPRAKIHRGLINRDADVTEVTQTCRLCVSVVI
jgi:hypothetical protein